MGAAQQTAIPASGATGGLNTVVTSTNRFDSLRNEAPIPGEPGEPLEETEFPAAITQNFGDSASEDEDEGGGVGIGGGRVEVVVKVVNRGESWRTEKLSLCICIHLKAAKH